MMLQFFKKTSGTRDRTRSSQSSPVKLTNSQKTSVGNGISGSSLICPKVSKSLGDEEEDDDEDIRGSLKIEISSARSRLSKTLSEILTDKEALSYFIQFMESRGKLALIKFWMEVECVREESNEYGDLSLSNSLDPNDNGLENGNDSSHKPVNDNDLTSKNTTRRCTVWQTISEEPNELSTIYQDAVRIYKKYINNDILKINEISTTLKPAMDEAVIAQNAPSLVKGLLQAQKKVYQVLEVEYINEFLRSDFHCKHQIDVLTSGDVKLADILFNETAFFYFIEFMELENKRELLDFWMSAINYKQNLLSKEMLDPMEAQSDALIIYEKFFSLQATMPLGFTDKIRFEVEQNICQEGNSGPQPDCYDKPSMIVYNFLSKYYLPAFLSSQLYYKYLTELISEIQSSTCAPHQQRVRRAGSDCSSEVSIVSVGTHDMSQISNSDGANRSTSDNTINGTMNIDTRQLYDPDSLWKRNKSSLSVGYVDNMGRFVTEIEPDPHRKYESRLSRAVKRLINMEQDKAKEELAWKIAEMIVREITSLTLGVSEPPS